MIRLLFLSFLFVSTAEAALTPRQEINRAKSAIGKLQDDISYLKLSAESLDNLYARLALESSQSDEAFRARLQGVLIPLLNWPNLIFPLDMSSWQEVDRMRLVMEEVQKRLVQKPLEMIADRELRLSEVENMKLELSSTLRLLGSKESMLKLQVEELRMIEKRPRRRLRHAKKKK